MTKTTDGRKTLGEINTTILKTQRVETHEMDTTGEMGTLA